MPPSQFIIDKALDIITSKAMVKQRAPTNDYLFDKCGWSGGFLIRELVNAGKIRSEVYATNYRVIEILTGKFAGVRTKESPIDSPPYYVSRPESAKGNPRGVR